MTSPERKARRNKPAAIARPRQMISLRRNRNISGALPCTVNSRASLSIAPFVGSYFFFNDTATTEIYTLSLHDALPISLSHGFVRNGLRGLPDLFAAFPTSRRRSEEHTSELQSQSNLVCRLLLEKKTGTGVVFRKDENRRLFLMLPVLKSPAQIPRAGLK